MDPMQKCHVKLLAFDFLSLTQKPSAYSSSNLTSLFRNSRPVSRVESLGVVVSVEKKYDRFLKFTIDDGTGCVPCILWLNHQDSPYFSRRNPMDVHILAQMAMDFASEIKLGVLARVRGKVIAYRRELQISVSDGVIERDPNAEILHWLTCVKLARNCYDATARPQQQQQQQQKKLKDKVTIENKTQWASKSQQFIPPLMTVNTPTQLYHTQQFQIP